MIVPELRSLLAANSNAMYTKPLAHAFLTDREEILRMVFLHQTIIFQSMVEWGQLRRGFNVHVLHVLVLRITVESVRSQFSTNLSQHTEIYI